MTALASEHQLHEGHKQPEQQLKRLQAAPTTSSGAIATANATTAKHQTSLIPTHHIGSPPLAHLAKRSRLELIGATNDHNYANLWAHQPAAASVRAHPPTAGAPGQPASGEHMDDCMAAMVLMFLSCRPDSDADEPKPAPRPASSQPEDDMIFELQQVHQVADSADDAPAGRLKCNSLASERLNQIDANQITRLLNNTKANSNTPKQPEHSSHQDVATASSASNLNVPVSASNQPNESPRDAANMMHLSPASPASSPSPSSSSSSASPPASSSSSSLSSSAGLQARRQAEQQLREDHRGQPADDAAPACYNLTYDHRQRLERQLGVEQPHDYQVSEHFRRRLLLDQQRGRPSEYLAGVNFHDTNNNNNNNNNNSNRVGADDDVDGEGEGAEEEDDDEEEEAEEEDDGADQAHNDIDQRQEQQPTLSRKEQDNLNLNLNLSRNLSRNHSSQLERRNHRHHQLRLHLNNPNKTRTIFSCMWPDCTKNYDSLEDIERHVRSHLGPKQGDSMIGEEDFYYEETEVDEATYSAIFNPHHGRSNGLPLSPSHNSDGLSSGQSFSSSSPATSPVCSTDSSSSTATGSAACLPGSTNLVEHHQAGSQAMGGGAASGAIDWSHFLQDQSHLLHAASGSPFTSRHLADKRASWKQAGQQHYESHLCNQRGRLAANSHHPNIHHSHQLQLQQHNQPQQHQQPNLLHYHFSHLAHQRRPYQQRQFVYRQRDAYISPQPAATARKRQQQYSAKRGARGLSPPMRVSRDTDWISAGSRPSSPPPLLDRAPSKSPPPLAESPPLAHGHKLQFSLQLSGGSSPLTPGTDYKQPRPAHLLEADSKRLNSAAAKVTKEHDHTYNLASSLSSPQALSSSPSAGLATAISLSSPGNSRASSSSTPALQLSKPSAGPPEGDSNSTAKGHEHQQPPEAPPELIEAPKPALPASHEFFHESSNQRFRGNDINSTTSLHQKQQQQQQQQQHKKLDTGNRFHQQTNKLSFSPGQLNGVNLSCQSKNLSLSDELQACSGLLAAAPSNLAATNHLVQSAVSSLRKARGENRKCRKVYGMDRRLEWCTQCKWKKACSRFCDQ